MACRYAYFGLQLELPRCCVLLSCTLQCLLYVLLVSALFAFKQNTETSTVMFIAEPHVVHLQHPECGLVTLDNAKRGLNTPLWPSWKLSMLASVWYTIQKYWLTTRRTPGQMAK